MLEAGIPVIIGLITGGGFLFSRIHTRQHDLDRRIDKVELRVAEAYVSKQDFNTALSKMEGHLIRIEEKMDALVNRPC